MCWRYQRVGEIGRCVRGIKGSEKTQMSEVVSEIWGLEKSDIPKGVYEVLEKSENLEAVPEVPGLGEI